MQSALYWKKNSLIFVNQKALAAQEQSNEKHRTVSKLQAFFKKNMKNRVADKCCMEKDTFNANKVTDDRGEEEKNWKNLLN